MMATSEAAVERRVCERGAELGCWVIKFLPHALAGFPDRLVLAPNGRTGYCELKRPGEEPESLQDVRHRRLRQLGHLVRVVEDDEGIEEFYRALLD